MSYMHTAIDFDLGGCGHCSARGPVTDCPACGEDRCAACAQQPCREAVMCPCGELREGHEVHWVDCSPLCESCDPIEACDGAGCRARVRRHEMTAREHRDDSVGFADVHSVCAGCAGNDECEDCWAERKAA